MKKPSNLTPEDLHLFRGEIAGVAPIKQDKIPPQPSRSKQKTTIIGKKSDLPAHARQIHAEFEFSDGFEAHFSHQGPLKYTQPGRDTHEVKRLRRGDYPPDLILDLHGLRRDEAKLEIAALIHTAQKQHLHCVCIVHGVGGQVLKNHVPSWLVQHPAVLAFHQAPLEWGGHGALLVLIDIPESSKR